MISAPIQKPIRTCIQPGVNAEGVNLWINGARTFKKDTVELFESDFTNLAYGDDLVTVDYTSSVGSWDGGANVTISDNALYFIGISRCMLNAAADLSSDLTLTTDYVIVVQYKVGAGDEGTFRIYDGSSNIDTTLDQTDYTEIEINFTADHATNCYMEVRDISSEEVWINVCEVRERKYYGLTVYASDGSKSIIENEIKWTQGVIGSGYDTLLGYCFLSEDILIPSLASLSNIGLIFEYDTKYIPNSTPYGFVTLSGDSVAGGSALNIGQVVAHQIYQRVSMANLFANPALGGMLLYYASGENDSYYWKNFSLRKLVYGYYFIRPIVGDAFHPGFSISSDFPSTGYTCFSYSENKGIKIKFVSDNSLGAGFFLAAAATTWADSLLSGIPCLVGDLSSGKFYKISIKAKVDTGTAYIMVHDGGTSDGGGHYYYAGTVTNTGFQEFSFTFISHDTDWNGSSYTEAPPVLYFLGDSETTITVDDFSIVEVAHKPYEELWNGNAAHPRLESGNDLLSGLGSCATDFMDAKGTGWSHDGTDDEYDVDGSQVANSDLREDSKFEADRTFRIVTEITKYTAGNFYQLCGTNTSGAYTATGTYYEILDREGDDSFRVRGDVDAIGSVSNMLINEVHGINEASYGYWIVYGNNTKDIDLYGLKITGVDNTSGMYHYFSAASGLSRNPIVGEELLFSCMVMVDTGNSVNLRVHDGVGYNTSSAITSTSWVPVEFTFTAGHTTDMFVNFSNLGIGEVAWITNMSLRKVF